MASIVLDTAKFVGLKCLSNIFINNNNSKRYHGNIRLDANCIIARLKFISKIRQGCQLDIHSIKLQPYSWWTTIERTFVRPTSRHDTISFITSTLDDAQLLLFYTKSQPECDVATCKNLLNDIVNCEEGIRNLSIHPNYKNDIYFTSQLDTIIENISSIKKANQYLYADELIASDPIPISGRSTPSTLQQSL